MTNLESPQREIRITLIRQRDWLLARANAAIGRDPSKPVVGRLMSSTRSQARNSDAPSAIQTNSSSCRRG
jgi:hypothetical protein